MCTSGAVNSLILLKDVTFIEIVSGLGSEFHFYSYVFQDLGGREIEAEESRDEVLVGAWSCNSTCFQQMG